MSASGTHFVDQDSPFAVPGELDLFSIPPTQLGVQASHWVNVRPKNVVDDGGPWLFELQTGPHYCLPCRNYLVLRLKLERKGNGVPIDLVAADVVAPINKIASTLIRSLKVYLGSKMISDSSELYAYRSILETELNFGYDVKESGHLTAALYARNSPSGLWDDVGNLGFDLRRKWFAGGEIEVLAPLTCDLFNTRKVLPSHSNLRVEISRNNDDFLITSHNAADAVGRAYHLRVVDLSWQVQMLELSKTASLAIETALLKTPAKYPLRLVRMGRLSIPRGSNRSPLNAVMCGQIPRRLIVGAVSRKAFNGDRVLDPFRFKHFNCSEISITAGGVQYPREPLRMNYEKDQYLGAYISFLENLGLGSPSNQAVQIHPEAYKQGLCLYAFDLSSDQTADGSHWDLSRQGSVTIDAHFSTPLTEDIELIIYAEQDSSLLIDAHREPHLTHMI